MPQNDIGTLEAIAAWLAMALSAVTAWAWRHTHGLLKEKASAAVVNELGESVKEKAEGAAVVLLAAQIKEKADNARVMDVTERLERAFGNQREDNQRIFGEISRVAQAHQAFTEKVIEELGRRPTREECAVMWRQRKDV